MTVAELIRRLQKMDPDAVVVRPWPHGDGWWDVHFVETTEDKYRPARQKFVKGVGAPDWKIASPRSRAKNLASIVTVS